MNIWLILLVINLLMAGTQTVIPLPHEYERAAFHPGGTHLALVTGQTIDIYRFSPSDITLEMQLVPSFPIESITTPSFSPNGELLIAGAMQRKLGESETEAILLRWNVSDGTPLEPISTGYSYNFGTPRQVEFGQDVFAFFFNLHNAGCGRSNNSLLLWNVNTNEERDIVEPELNLFATDLHEVRLALLTGDYSCSPLTHTIRVRDTSTGEENARVVNWGADGRPYYPMIALNEDYVVWLAEFYPTSEIGFVEDGLVIWDANTLENVATYRIEEISTFALNPQGDELAVIAEGRLFLIDIGNDQVEELAQFDALPRSVTFSADGTYLVTLAGSEMYVNVLDNAD